MSIYEKLFNARDAVMKSEDIETVEKYGKVEILSQLMLIVFRNRDELPKNFNLKNYDYGTEPLKIFLEEYLGLELLGIKRKVNLKPFEIFYEVTLI